MCLHLCSSSCLLSGLFGLLACLPTLLCVSICLSVVYAYVCNNESLSESHPILIISVIVHSCLSVFCFCFVELSHTVLSNIFVVCSVGGFFRAAILACSSYVALGLGDYVNALEYGQQLLSLPLLSGIHR